MELLTHVPAGPPPGGAYSPAVLHEGVVMTAGHTGTDPSTGAVSADLVAQIHLAIDNLERTLAAAGSDLGNVLKTTCYLVDVARFEEFDAVYAERFGDHRPARSTVGVQLAGPLLFEIEAVALVGSRR